MNMIYDGLVSDFAAFNCKLRHYSMVATGDHGSAQLCEDHRCAARVHRAAEAGEVETRCRGLSAGGQWCPAHGCRHPGCPDASAGEGFLCLVGRCRLTPG